MRQYRATHAAGTPENTTVNTKYTDRANLSWHFQRPFPTCFAQFVSSSWETHLRTTGCHHGSIQPPRRGGELPPPETKLLPLDKDHQLPLRGSTCFGDQLTRPLHANLLLQHETVDIHTTKQLK